MRDYQPGVSHAISYGPHRDGQDPGGPGPSAAEIREDLQLILPHWNLLRVYGAVGVTETILQVIKEDGLDLKVMLGAWIDQDDEAGNQAEIQSSIRLANLYPEIVTSVSVGNETQVYWSAHRNPLPELIRYVRQVREAVKVPVTVADDYNYWDKPESKELAAEIDFITLHAHPHWNRQQLHEAVPWLETKLNDVQALHPDHLVVIGETGWATMVQDEGEQAELITGAYGEAEQKVFYDAVRAWAEEKAVTVFYFEAFDENWKGGPHPDEVEKHWGVFNTDRTPKAAMK